ncbi:Protein TIFY 5A [Cardamine amara subsp. amara]|uniref:Protein TIFY n=1 Tax=Cardamine amara subsp. amara TaxID=228776 RepID=A0ABD1B228_CARAN
MKMHQTCDLELRLFPTSSSDSDSDTSVIESSSSGNPQPKEESQRITIFYNGKMCISSDVTHLQAKSIISIASQEMEEKSSSNGSDSQNRSTRFHHHQQLPNPKASMKKSLQNFLQKRKLRIQATSPYHQHSRR